MRLVFWQNSFSQHQLPYITKLIEDERVDSVIIVVACTVTGDRKSMGWDIPDICGLDKLEIHISPLPTVIEHLFSIRTEDSVHLFSGIRAFDFIFSAFRISLKYNVKRGLIVELPNTFAHGRANCKPLWMHRIKWFINDRNNTHAFDYVFAMGDSASDFYRKINRKWKVFSFSYCTQSINNQHSTPPQKLFILRS